MTLKDLRNAIDGILSRHRDAEDLEIKIVTNDNSIGGSAGVGLKYCHKGFDFDNQYILLCPDDVIYREPKSIPADIYAVKINEASQWVYECSDCHSRVSKPDKFCRHCGRKFSGQVKKYDLSKKN